MQNLRSYLAQRRNCSDPLKKDGDMVCWLPGSRSPGPKKNETDCDCLSFGKLNSVPVPHEKIRISDRDFQSFRKQSTLRIRDLPDDRAAMRAEQYWSPRVDRPPLMRWRLRFKISDWKIDSAACLGAGGMASAAILHGFGTPNSSRTAGDGEPLRCMLYSASWHEARIESSPNHSARSL
jgi:hypothetical protein